MTQIADHPLSPSIEQDREPNPLEAAGLVPSTSSSSLFGIPSPPLAASTTHRSSPFLTSTSNGNGNGNGSAPDDEHLEASGSSLLDRRRAGRSTSPASSSSRPSLPSHPTVRPSAEPSVPPILSLPHPPHIVPSSLLSALPHSHLLALVRSLSRDLDMAQATALVKEQEVEALVALCSDKGIGKGEVERTRVRARVGLGESTVKVKQKEWKIDLDQGVTTGEIEERIDVAETQPTLDLDDLAAAISENAFDFRSQGDDTSLRNHLSDDDADETESISRLSISSSIHDPPTDYPISAPTTINKNARPRHASISTRIFSTFSLSPPPPLPVGAPPLLPSSSSSSSLSKAASTTGTTTPAAKIKRRSKRSDSLLSSSSIASASSLASSEGPIPTKGEGMTKSESGYGEWLGWKTWSRTPKDRPAESRRKVPTELLPPPTPSLDDSPSSSTASLASGDFAGHLREDTSATVSTHIALSRTPTTQSSHTASDALSSPTTSVTPSSLLTPDSKTRETDSTSPSSPSPAASARPRGPSFPLLTPQHSAVSPTLTTPIPTSTLSTPLLSTPHRLTASLNHSRKSSRSVERATADRIIHPSHFTAVTQAAAAWMTSESSTTTGIFRSNRVGAQIRQLVDALLGNVAEEAPVVSIDSNDPELTVKAGRKSSTASKSPPPFLSLAKPLYSAQEGSKPKEKGYVASAKGTIGRAFGLGASTSSIGSLSAIDGLRRVSGATEEPNLTLFPTLSKYSPFAQPALSTPSTTVSLSSHTPSSPLPVPIAAFHSNPTTMELDTISGEAAPPTLNPNSAALRGSTDSDEGPLVDRYGFVYDIRSGMKLLRDSRRRQERAARGSLDEGSALHDAAALIEEASPAAAELIAHDEVESELEMLREALGLPPSNATSPTYPRSPDPRTRRLADDASSEATLNGSPVVPQLSAPPRSARLVRSPSSSDANGVGGPQSMKRLLSQLTEMHDAADKTQKEAWDAFIQRRQAKLGRKGAVDGEEDDAGWSENLVGVAQMGTAGKTGKDDWTGFKKLVRRGVPISYRPKIWAECSGANEAREPGLYQELLSQHRGEENQCLNQIDMDCHRTFPTNVFFAGNGPGVAKLRNVLIAYSWRNPKIGYCQGMNNLTATLLLTHPAEEDAFWVLVCMIEKILPSDYYTSHLLVSQADQRVLSDLVAKVLPEVAAYLEELGVELPAITFGWFLSLFTDALPMDTLLRIWDLFFVFGSVILFRVSIAILSMNQVEILACDSAATLYALMRTMTAHLYQVEKVLKIACEDLRPLVRDRDISLLRNKHVADLRREMAISADEDER